MSYQPGDARDTDGPYDGHGYRRNDYPDRDRRYNDGVFAVIAVIRVLIIAVIVVFALHVLFIVLGANADNAFVSVDRSLARILVFGMGDVFTPQDAVLGAVLNYGFAALVYALIYVVTAQLAGRSLRRR